MVKGYNWTTIVFFATTTLGALIGTPWYFLRFGISLPEILLTLFFIIATGMGITVGYHRHYAHTTFKTNPIIQFLILFFGAAAFEQTALIWASGHRDHHRYVDTEADPYSIKKGFWYAHIGWMTLWKQEPDFENAKDLLKNKMVMHQHRYYALWSLFAGILFPVFLGALMGHALGALILAVFFRVTFVYHATFCINSVCHTFGKATYDIHATAKDHWFVALLTNGEGYHNFHHRFPTDYRNGVRRYQWDPSKWVIALLARTGMAWDLKRVSKFSILEAKLAAENQTVSERFTVITDPHRFAHLKEIFQTQYIALTQKLSAWEAIAQSQRRALSASMAGHSHDLQEATHERIEQAKLDFEKARREWQSLTRSWIQDPAYAYAVYSNQVLNK